MTTLDFVRKIGSGANGSVGLYKDRSESEKKYAIKNSKHPNTMKKEAKILEKLMELRRDDILKINQYVPPYELVTEYVEGETLHDFVYSKVLDDAMIRALFKKIIEAVKACHTLKVYHFDLKSDNIMVKPDESIVLIDFGMAQMKTDKDADQTDCSNKLFKHTW